MENLFDSLSQAGVCESHRVFHTPSDFARKNLFYVQEAGTLRSIKTHICKRDQLDSFLFLIVLSGRGTLRIGDKGFPLMPLDCALVDCKSPYSHQSSDHDPWSLMWVHFNGPHVQAYFDYFKENTPSTIFHIDTADSITSTITAIINLQNEQDYTVEVVSSKLITDLLTICFTTTRRQRSINSMLPNSEFEVIREYLNANFQNNIDITEVASRLGLSDDRIQNDFKSIYGITIDQYILSRRLTKAKELLRFTNKSIASIAKACGIGEEKDFIQIFQSIEKMTPMQHRIRWSQGN